MDARPDDNAHPDSQPASDDESLIRWMLGLSPAERLAVLQAFVDGASELRLEPWAGTESK